MGKIYWGSGTAVEKIMSRAGGGGGARSPNVPTENKSRTCNLAAGEGGQDPQMYRQKINHVHVTYMREGERRASASETYIPIFMSQNTCYICIYYHQCAPYYYL